MILKAGTTIHELTRKEVRDFSCVLVNRPMRPRMKLIILSMFLAVSLFSSAAAREVQEGRIIDRIEFEGLQQVSRDEALATSGLQTGRLFKVEEVDAAAQRLLDSGLFKEIGYRTNTSGNKITITFKIEEAVGGDSPVVFDNLFGSR